MSAPKTILVVDDEVNIVDLIEINLLKEGFNVVKAYDGEEAFKLAQSRPPDMIISDVNMPKLDGFGLLKKLKSQMSLRRIPVVMLTARAGDEDVFRGWSQGADQYLTKPFNPAQLVFIVKKIFADREKMEREKYKDKYVIE